MCVTTIFDRNDVFACQLKDGINRMAARFYPISMGSSSKYAYGIDDGNLVGQFRNSHTIRSGERVLQTDESITRQCVSLASIGIDNEQKAA